MKNKRNRPKKKADRKRKHLAVTHRKCLFEEVTLGSNAQAITGARSESQQTAKNDSTGNKPSSGDKTKGWEMV